ncbi:SMI1/KNR4 family protein [Lignipirellula cremea]|uniref:Knr4/Smi1-like domain-containing protein n=1 Tax=Lignipirellula cremea TaxID=2528010 RepID=A0A518DV39_9BACT|nr:SMI1/KNR4 family protein [Lignipirellula cremea]QDU95706.1 hypothetical protein Pla8534_35230 [Lignipirellula cremea]
MAYEKLSHLGAKLFGEKAKDLEAAIQSVEQILPMSDSFRELLLAFGGAIWFDNGARFRPQSPNPQTDEDGYNSLDVLYGLGDGEDSIEQRIEQYDGELPESFVAIGEAPGGNQICVGGDGVVYFWDHESLRNDQTWPIAGSVDEFIAMLEIDDEEPGDSDGVIESEAWLDF